MCGFFYTIFIDLMIKDKGLLDYTNLFSPSENEKNHEIILEYFKQQTSHRLYPVVLGKGY